MQTIIDKVRALCHHKQVEQLEGDMLCTNYIFDVDTLEYESTAQLYISFHGKGNIVAIAGDLMVDGEPCWAFHRPQTVAEFIEAMDGDVVQGLYIVELKSLLRQIESNKRLVQVTDWDKVGFGDYVA